MAHDDRKVRIGSSDAADILSGSWDRLYKLKMGLIEPDDLSDNFKVQFGKFTEEFHLDWSIRKLIEEKQDTFKWSKFADNGDQHHAAYQVEDFDNPPLLVSHPDAIVRDPLGRILPMEVKHTGRFKNADEAADHYMPQIQHHLLCWDAPVLLFSVIVGNDEPERIWVGKSLEWQQHYIERCVQFWKHITTKTPPSPAFYGEAKEAKPYVPTKISDTVPINGFKKRDLSNSNHAPALIDEFISTKAVVARHEEVKTELKEMMQPDENLLYSPKIQLKRDARGAIRITVKEEKAA